MSMTLPQGQPVKNVNALPGLNHERAPLRESLQVRESGAFVSDLIVITPIPKNIFWRFIDAIQYIFTGGPLFGGLVDEDGLCSRKPGLGGRIYECIFEGCPEEETGLLGDAARAARQNAFQHESDSEEDQIVEEEFDPSFDSEEISKRQKESRQVIGHQNPYL